MTKFNERTSRKLSLKVWTMLTRPFMKIADTLSDDHPHFLRYAADLAGVLRNTIFVDQVVYPLSKKQELLHLLEEHITENIVKVCGESHETLMANMNLQIGQSYYRQMIGIPQGSVLSSLLCSFFYGDLEKRFLKYMTDPHSVCHLNPVDSHIDFFT